MFDTASVASLAKHQPVAELEDVAVATTRDQSTVLHGPSFYTAPTHTPMASPRQLADRGVAVVVSDVLRRRRPGNMCAVTLVRRWWPIVAFIAAALALQTILLREYDAHGHAAAHLSSAKVVFFGSALIAIVLWSTPSARRYPDVWIACGAWIAALVGVAIGNLRVVDAIGGADWTDEQADALGAGLRGFESGHDLSEISSWLGIAAAIVLTMVLVIRRQVGTGVAIGAVVFSLVFPRWIIPGAGVLIVAVALCIARGRRPQVAT